MRVGTHALTEGSGTKLWSRLKQNRGQQKTGGGNHRGSIFRLIVGTALMARNGHDCPSWGHGNNAPADVRAAEHPLECEVSKVICAMPFLWLAIDDEPGTESLRGYIEAMRSRCSAISTRSLSIRRVPAGSGILAVGNGYASRAFGTRTMWRRLTTLPSLAVSKSLFRRWSALRDRRYPMRRKRDRLLAYNASPGTNPLGLLPAFELYENDIYRALVKQFGVETYILSVLLF